MMTYKTMFYDRMRYLIFYRNKATFCILTLKVRLSRPMKRFGATRSLLGFLSWVQLCCQSTSSSSPERISRQCRRALKQIERKCGIAKINGKIQKTPTEMMIGSKRITILFIKGKFSIRQLEIRKFRNYVSQKDYDNHSKS